MTFGGNLIRWPALRSALSFLAVLLPALLIQLASSSALRGEERIPKDNLVLWTWDRFEDLRFIRSADYGVAYYAGTFHLTRDHAAFIPRQHKLLLPPTVTNIRPVFRIENDAQSSPGVEAADYVCKTISGYLSQRDQRSLQVDYDATVEDRAFYIALLNQLRHTLPSDSNISMTALASWCLDDRWLNQANADEAVMMLFSMGSATNETLQAMHDRQPQIPKGMHFAIGLSVNELKTAARVVQSKRMKNAEKFYLFSSLPWNEERLSSILKGL